MARQADSFALVSEDLSPGAVPGFRSGAVHCGLKHVRHDGRRPDDLALLWAEDGPVPAAAVFTQNRVAAAPVELSRQHVAGGKIRSVVVNSGNANCATGAPGRRAARRMAELTAAALGGAPEEVLVCSTGIIGVPLPLELVEAGIAAAAERAKQPAGERGDFSAAIMTTDTVRKQAVVRGHLGGRPFVIAGAAKGSGMIAPRMATMLAFITTDLAVGSSALRAALEAANARSFNRLTVDGDTSTNDTLLVLASGRAGNAPIEQPSGPAYELLREALTAAAISLAQQIARDGEGATKFITIRVSGAASEAEAEQVARTVAESCLFKCAAYGCDPNWGRVLAAAGRAGAQLDPEKFRLVLEAGSRKLTLFAGTPQPNGAEELAAAMAEHDLTFALDLGLGAGAATVWTCDLSHGYVTINAAYHT